MDYNNINKIDNDGNGNIILQDIDGSSVTINYNNLDSIQELFERISESQAFEIKQSIGKQHQDILVEIRKIQDLLDARNMEKKAEKSGKDLEGFLKELNAMKMEGIKKRLLTNYKLQREYEELLILEDDPRRKLKYQKEIETFKGYIESAENELKGVVKK
jgi:hypothetical protein